jgi:putative inorganic carbon (HCO3(-)) transporter
VTLSLGWQRQSVYTALGVVLALAAGLFIALQPVGNVVIIGTALAFALLAAITPLAALMGLLILAPMRTLIATEAPLQLPLDIGQIALVLFVGAWAASRIARGQRLLRLRWTPLYIPLLLFLAVAGLSIINALSVGKWITEWVKWVQIVFMIALVMDLGSDNLWEWLVLGLTLSGLANALVGIYEFFGGSGALHLLVSGRFFRAFGTFGQPNPFGGFMGLLTPVALMAAVGYAVRLRAQWRSRQRILRHSLALLMFYLLSSGIMLVGIIFSWSRGAWLGLGGAFLVILITLPRRNWLGLLMLLAGVGGLALVWFTDLLPHSIIDRLSSSTQELFAFEDVRGIDITPENYAVAERLAHWQAALNIASYHPWLGIGFGNYEAAYPAYQLLNWSEPLGHAHNYYLNILAETGILGLLAYGKVWLSIIAMSWRARRHPDALARFVVVGLLGTWTYLLIHSFFDNLYVNNVFIHLGLMLGLSGVLYNQAWNSKRVIIP